jgi:hypothetical protein
MSSVCWTWARCHHGRIPWPVFIPNDSLTESSRIHPSLTFFAPLFLFYGGAWTIPASAFYAFILIVSFFAKPPRKLIVQQFHHPVHLGPIRVINGGLTNRVVCLNGGFLRRERTVRSRRIDTRLFSSSAFIFSNASRSTTCIPGLISFDSLSTKPALTIHKLFSNAGSPCYKVPVLSWLWSLLEAALFW